MRDVLSGSEDDLAEGSRRHGAWGLLVLACVALIVVGLMILLGTPGSASHNDGAAPVTPSLQPSHSPLSVQSSQSPTTTSAGSRSVTGVSSSPSPVRTGNPCTTGATCTVGGDGGAVVAFNAYRTAHHAPTVTGSVTANAQACALTRTTGPTCVPHYIWTSVGGQNGADAVAQFASNNPSWVLDPKMETVGVGWAYVGGQYSCVLLKSP